MMVLTSPWAKFCRWLGAVTYAGKLEVVFEEKLIFEGYGDLSTRLSTVLVKRFDRQDPSKRRKTSSGSGGRAATPLAEATEVFSLLPPGVAWGPHHTGTTEKATPSPENVVAAAEVGGASSKDAWLPGERHVA